jgi:mono/diheme cytochrome c family protein
MDIPAYANSFWAALPAICCAKAFFRASSSIRRDLMSLCNLGLLAVLLTSSIPALAAPAGDVAAGRQLVLRSCSSCHDTGTTATATDGAPPLSFIAKDNKQRPAWIRGWLMDPHPPMPGIMLSRKQVDDIIAYLNSLPGQ